ncbi:hypothetical protein [Limnobacter sp.]|uniref:hypothetical protein n=1 Tax=Limnobacter sp. TaxID=2003368 RepID=UPI00258614B5|nr:hypothetical protein [Limnobacter sp.]
MVSGLIFGLASLFAPQADLPQVASVQHELAIYAQDFSLDPQRVYVRNATFKNPSPFLTSGASTACVVYINDNGDSRRVWSHMLDGADAGLQQAFATFSTGHELTHCLLAEPGQRVAKRESLERFLGVRFKNNVQFEETYGDLVGLAFLKQQDPEHFQAVFDRLKEIRQEFADRDPEHDSSAFLSEENSVFASQLAARKTTVAVASNP